jgi:hypothetical protein
MTINQIEDTLTFPLSIHIEKENFLEIFQSKEGILNKFKGYKVNKIGVNKDAQIVQLDLIQLATLEELGYSFESGV